MGMISGLCVWAFARFIGLDLAVECGVIAFLPNCIPFIGPPVATIFPALFAILQLAAWEVALVVLVAMNLIQSIPGKQIEPLPAAATLAVSSFVVLLAVCLRLLLRRISGVFIGMPALVAALTICEGFPAAQPVLKLPSGRKPDPASP